jgi:hypothetical protein
LFFSYSRCAFRDSRGAWLAFIDRMIRWRLLVDRRRFLCASFAGMAAVLAPPCIRLLPAQANATLGIAVILDERGPLSPEARGIALGLREARHAGTLFNRRILDRRITDLGELRDEQVVIFAGNPSRAQTLSDASVRRGVVFLNAVSSDDALRRRGCSAWVFHVAASDAMKAGAPSSSPGTVEMWHPDLFRYGAGELNDRFRETGAPMHSGAWATWMAVKIAWESFLRTDGSAASIAAHLARGTTHFDGHKGMPLSFRSWDHQLRQPLYVVRHTGAPVVEFPPFPRSGGSMKDVLDTIGDKPEKKECA